MKSNPPAIIATKTAGAIWMPELSRNFSKKYEQHKRSRRTTIAHLSKRDHDRNREKKKKEKAKKEKGC
jgi:hypothetical protein